MVVKPYQINNESKKTQVAAMFNNIAYRYDFLNHLLSLGIDRYWRKRAVRFLKDKKPLKILDVATGTGDLAITAWKMLKPEKITGIDISDKMLDIGKQKILNKFPEANIELQHGDSESLNFEDNVFDAVTVAFGVRNFENPHHGLSEIYRVLKRGGWFVILEFSKPRRFPVKQIYGFYFYVVLPSIGRFFSKDKRAYKYLPESVTTFPEGENLIQYLNNAGFTHCSYQTLTLGITTIYTARKP